MSDYMPDIDQLPAPEALRVTVANKSCDFLSPSTVRQIVCRVLRKQPDPQNWSEYPNVFDEVQRLLMECAEKKVYKAIDAICEFLETHQPDNAVKFVQEINECFEEEDIDFTLVTTSDAGTVSMAQQRSTRVQKSAPRTSRVPSEARIARIFIGSSSEGTPIALQVQHDLHRTVRAQPRIWSQGVFELGSTTIESLLNSLDDYDFAVFILSPDDLTASRHTEKLAPRDNVIFELGMFMGRLGPKRTFILFDKTANLKILSDLAGVTMAEYDGDWAVSDMPAAIGAACHPIRAAISKLGIFEN